jgi:hydrogenase maturation protease
MQKDEQILVLGLGNVLMSDEGIGVRAIDFLSKHHFPDNISLLDGGTGGFHLLSLFDEYQSFILIDATISDGDAGVVSVIKPRFASDFPRSLTSHDIGLRDLIQSAQLLGDLPDIT